MIPYFDRIEEVGACRSDQSGLANGNVQNQDRPLSYSEDVERGSCLDVLCDLAYDVALDRIA